MLSPENTPRHFRRNLLIGLGIAGAVTVAAGLVLQQRNKSPRATESRELVLKVVYDPSVMAYDVPYIVRVNRAGATALLLTHGMPQEQLLRTSLIITRSADVGDEGEYDYATGQIRIYGDLHWPRRRSRINGTFLHEARHALDHKLVVQRHIEEDYSLRTTAFSASGVFLPFIIAGGSVLAGINYEPALPLVSLGVMLGIGSFVISPEIASFAEYWTRETERRARRFEKLLRKDPAWQNIVTIEARK